MTPTHPALLLTAGLGLRLDPLTRVRAKPAVPVAGEPLARRIVRWLVRSGVRDITCNLHHLPHTLTTVLGDGTDLGAAIRYSWEQPLLLGSAGGPRQALDILGADRFFLVNGDTLTDVSLDAVRVAHEESGAEATLALVPNQEPLRYGGVVLSPDGSVRRFVPRGPAATGSFHFIGVQLVEARVFADLPKGVAADSFTGVYTALMARLAGSVRGVVVDATFFDIGTVADYRRTSAALAADAGHMGVGVHVAPNAQVTRSILWDDITIGEGASIDACIVTDGVWVPAGAVYSHAVLLRDGRGNLSALPMPD